MVQDVPCGAAPSRFCIWVSYGRLDFSVPQGSVLCPIFFLLYTAELFEVINRKELVAHSHADDTEVHLSVPASESSVAAGSSQSAMRRSTVGCRQTDSTKQLIWIGTCQQLSKVGINEIELRLNMVSFSSLHVCVVPGRDSPQSAQDDRSCRGSLSILFLSTGKIRTIVRSDDH